MVLFLATSIVTIRYPSSSRLTIVTMNRLRHSCSLPKKALHSPRHRRHATPPPRHPRLYPHRRSYPHPQKKSMHRDLEQDAWTRRNPVTRT